MDRKKPVRPSCLRGKTKAAFTKYPWVQQADLQRILALRGYWVVWCDAPHPIGARTLPLDALTVQPFVVVSETDKADHDEQMRVMGLDPVVTPSGTTRHFYRIVTD